MGVKGTHLHLGGQADAHMGRSHCLTSTFEAH